MNVVKTGELKIIPDQYRKIWYHWMENIRDWCISRQLWWGHRIPAYSVKTINPVANLKVSFENIMQINIISTYKFILISLTMNIG